MMNGNSAVVECLLELGVELNTLDVGVVAPLDVLSLRWHG